jgi:hypothetical protein
MTSLERILTCLDHKSPDRIPFDLGSSFTTGITKNAYMALARALGQPVENPPLYDVIQQLAVVDESILEQLGVDVRGLIPNVVRKNPELLDQDGVQVDSKGLFETLNGVEIIEGSNVVELIAVNSSGRKSSPTKFSLELIVPQKVEFTLYNNLDELVEIDGAYYTTDRKPRLHLR